MSLHWSETVMNISFGTLYGSELRVLVEPGAIDVTLLKRDFVHGFKAHVANRLLIKTDAPNTETIAPNLLCKLAESLQNPAWHCAAPMVVLSNAFVHYAMLPWNSEITNKAERAAYLQHVFANQYGELTDHWHLNAHTAGFGMANIASGVNKSLLEQLEATFSATALPLKGVHPLLMQATNQALAHLKTHKLPQSFWLACIENRRLVLALLVNGDWKSVRNMAAETDPSAQIHTLIQREAVLAPDYLQLPVLLHGAADIALPNLIRLSNQMQPDDFAHSIQPKWAA